jgi:bifunctional UDP-N-acetylglucosamine pyrophosphorylase/glucosamine-1-phosphate N-acetyltransferase
MAKRPFTAIILAAGKGTRMNSPLPKVLHPVAGVPMISRAIESVKKAGAKEVRVVVGHGANLIKPLVEPLGAICFEQKNQLGTADAVKSAKPESIEGDVIIFNGDHPLIMSEDFKVMLDNYIELGIQLALVTAKLKRPGSLGRVVRQKGELKAIVEAKDASNETLKIKEVNAGIYITDSQILQDLLPKIQSNNAQKEFYLTDLITLAIESGLTTKAMLASQRVAMGVNDQIELSRASRICFARKNKALMERGVMMIDPSSVFIEDTVEIGSGSVIYPNVFIKGKSKLGSFVVVEPQCWINDCEIYDSVQIRLGSHLEKAVIHPRCLVGPYARIRPETEVGAESHIGNFVELKKVKLGEGVKANHLTYLGDAEIGDRTNIGCGTITCNYAPDKKKYKTVIGKDAFIGSDTQFIAPVNVGDFAVVGSGSTITKDVPDRALAVTRAKQFIKENYVKTEK